MRSLQTLSRSAWIPGILVIALFWLSSNLVLDLLVMPVMHLSGMTAQTDFASTGYTLFWTFNRLELLCAALILTGVLAVRRQPGEFEVAHGGSRCRWAIGLGCLLLSLTLMDTYVLTPEMSGLALSLNPWTKATVSAGMNWLHGTYWLLESLKVLSLCGLAALCLTDLHPEEPQDAIA